MTDDIAAVPASGDPGYGEAVSDDEFSEWVTRSQADTDATLREWDSSVEFYERPGRTEFHDDEEAPAQFDGLASVVESMDGASVPSYEGLRRHRFNWSQIYTTVTITHDYLMEYPNEARRTLEAQGFEILEASPTRLNASKLIIPTDGISEAVRREFGLD